MMSLFKNLFSIKLQCPYCQKELPKVPRSKAKCPHCGQRIYVKAFPPQWEKRLYTEAQAKEVEQQEKRRKQKEADEKWGQLNHDLQQAMRRGDLQVMQNLYRDMALIAHQRSRPSFKLQQVAHEMELRYYEKSKLTKVEVLGTNCCDVCQAQNGLVVSISEAMKNQPIPQRGCTNKINNEAPDCWCVCTYIPVVG